MRLLILLLSTAILTGARAEAAIEPPSLTLKETIQKGISYSPELKQSDSGIKGSQADLDRARGAIFPTVNATGAAKTTQNSAAVTQSTNPGVGNVVNNYSTLLNLTQPLYAGGAITSALNLAKSNEDIARQKYFSSKQTVTFDIISAYYDLAQAQQSLSQADLNSEILRAYLGVTEHYEKIGRSRQIDRMQAQVNLSLAVTDAETIRDDLNGFQANLNRAIGEDMGRSLKANFRAVISPVGVLTSTTAFESAMRNNPDIRTAVIKVEQVDYSEDVDLAVDRPSLNLVGNYGYSAPNADGLFKSNSQTYTIGLNLTIPLFSGLTSFAKSRGFAERKYQAEKDLQIIKETTQNKIENTLHTVKSALSQVDMAIISERQGKEALELANKSFRQGVASTKDVVDLQRVRYEAGKSLVVAQFRYLNALLKLRQLMGIDLEKAYAQ